jgi:hypothetical protein
VILEATLGACRRLSHEIDPATGDVYRSHQGEPDLAIFQHTSAAQGVGRAICRAIECLLEDEECTVAVDP